MPIFTTQAKDLDSLDVLTATHQCSDPEIACCLHMAHFPSQQGRPGVMVEAMISDLLPCQEPKCQKTIAMLERALQNQERGCLNADLMP